MLLVGRSLLLLLLARCEPGCEQWDGHGEGFLVGLLSALPDAAQL